MDRYPKRDITTCTTSMRLGLSPVIEVNPDVWHLIFDELAGDYASLCSVSLTCRTWHILSEPSLFKAVDISSHNNGRLHEHEHSTVLPVAYADYRAEWRPHNLVSRQRAFLKRISARPALAKYVKTFVWTFTWLDWYERDLKEIDRQTWTIFSLMKNVTQLDLGSLHETGDEPYVRQNPAELFPRVTDLRLMGWMHRGLVKALVTSLDTKKLRSLKLDYLQDEGAMPNGEPISYEVALEYARHLRSPYPPTIIDDELLLRQETGRAAIFPGPMWYPMKLLSVQRVPSLTELQVTISSLDPGIDLRSYYTVFDETANLILAAKDSLSTLKITFGEDRNFYDETKYVSACGTGRGFETFIYWSMCITMAATYLNKVLAVLNNNSFPQLESVVCEGFHFLEHVSPQEAATAGLDATFQAKRECRISNASFTEISCVDYRWPWPGHDCEVQDIEAHRATLENS